MQRWVLGYQIHTKVCGWKNIEGIWMSLCNKRNEVLSERLT